MKEFVTAVEKAEQEPDEADLIFAIDGHEMRAYKPTEGQFALLMMAMGRHTSNTDQFAGVIDFFIQVLDAPSQKYVIDRMMTRDEIIPLEKIVEVMEWMIEEWGGRPFPEALRLYIIAAERWAEIDGHYASIDLITMPPHRFMNFVYAWCVERIDPEKREQWEAMLTDVLPGRERATPAPFQAEQEGADFMATLAMHQARTA